MPVIAGSEVNDDPLAPISRWGRDQVEKHGDATEVAWIGRDARYGEKLATPDVSVADLIGEIDPIRVAEGRYLADESTIHFGLIPRTNRGIFCINELPDLAEKVQVGLFNVMEERDFQVKGFKVRLPLDVLVVASANPEDYTRRGRIITPLKDRYQAQIRTHYPPTRELEIDVMKQERRKPREAAGELYVPHFIEQIIAELTIQARKSPDVSQLSGVSVRASIANYETIIAEAERRALRLGEREAVPRLTDLPGLRASMGGKIELEYAGAEKSEGEILENLMKRSVLEVFSELSERARPRRDRARLRRRLEGRGRRASCPRRSTPTASTTSRGCARRSSCSAAVEPGAHRGRGRVRARGAAPLEQAQPRGRGPPTDVRMTASRLRYSRWDGTQRAFSLAAEQALDELARHLMEGMSVEEALSWMRYQGFELAGMDFRVMGVEELLAGAPPPRARAHERQQHGPHLRRALAEAARHPRARGARAGRAERRRVEAAGPTSTRKKENLPRAAVRGAEALLATTTGRTPTPRPTSASSRASSTSCARSRSSTRATARCCAAATTCRSTRRSS